MHNLKQSDSVIYSPLPNIAYIGTIVSVHENAVKIGYQKGKIVEGHIDQCILISGDRKG